MKTSAMIRKSVLKMEGYTPGEQPQEAGFIKLNTNENPYPPSLAVKKAFGEFDAGRLRLYPDPMSVLLRKRMAEINNCKLEQVFAGNGSDEVLALCTRAFVEPDGGSVGYFNPSYSLYGVLADIQDVEKKPVELAADFGWQMPKGYKCSLFFLACPNAPTGMQYPRKTVEDFCRSFPGIVLIDEAYADFARESFMDMALRLPNVLVSRSFSKSYSLAGLRVGYVVGNEALIEAMYKLKDSYNIDAISQRLALAALSDLSYMKNNVEKIKATRRRLTGVLQDMGFTVCPSETNFLWVKPGKGSAKALFEGLKIRKVLVRYFPGKRTGDYLRISIGTNEEINKLIDTLRELV